MARTDSLLDLLGLKLLSRRPRSYGYAIMSAIAETSGNILRAEEGSLYPALHRMEEAGWIRAEWVRSVSAPMSSPRLASSLYEEESRWQAVTAAVNRV